MQTQTYIPTSRNEDSTIDILTQYGDEVMYAVQWYYEHIYAKGLDQKHMMKRFKIWYDLFGTKVVYQAGEVIAQL